MRVLLIAYDTEELSIRLASALSKQLYVHLVLPERSSLAFTKWLAPSVHFETFLKPRLREPLKQVLQLARLRAMAKEFDPDVIHFQKSHLWFYLGLPLFRRWPIVLSVHDPLPHVGDKPSSLVPRWLLRLGYRSASVIIAHNEKAVESLVGQFGISPAQIHLTPLLERGDSELAAQTPERGSEILFFGRIWPYKGLEYLLLAAPLIADQYPDLKIVIAGEGESLEQYPELHDSKRFEVHNEFVTEEKAAELFRRASIVVLPYVDATQSAVIPTAYTFSRPVVASAVGGLPSQVEDGKTGLLVPPRDAHALADAILALLTNPTKRHRMGAAGHAKLKDEWSSEEVARQTLEAYDLAVALRK